MAPTILEGVSVGVEQTSDGDCDVAARICTQDTRFQGPKGAVRL